MSTGLSENRKYCSTYIHSGHYCVKSSCNSFKWLCSISELRFHCSVRVAFKYFKMTTTISRSLYQPSLNLPSEVDRCPFYNSHLSWFFHQIWLGRSEGIIRSTIVGFSASISDKISWISLPPSLESPGSPQRQPGPCLRPPGPRPPGSDLHDDNEEKEEDTIIKMIMISPEWPGPIKPLL